MDAVTVLVRAKINLNLHITGRRGNGYHELDGVFQSISLCDLVLTERADGIFVEMDGEIQGGDNSAFKALTLIKSEFGFGGRVSIKKGIPFSAGLGGSAADAAAVLFAAQMLHGIDCSHLAIKCGSDVPFMMLGGRARVTGAGERVQPLSSSETLHLLIVKPSGGVSTKAAYDYYDAAPKLKAENDLQEAAFALNGGTLRAYVALNQYSNRVLVSGSGSSVFAVFDSMEDALGAKAEIENAFEFCEYATANDRGIEVLL